jgi:alpha-2-macroglobulin
MHPGTKRSPSRSPSLGSTSLKARPAVSRPDRGRARDVTTVVDEALFAIAPKRTDFLSFFACTRRDQLVDTRTSFMNRRFRPKPMPHSDSGAANGPGQAPEAPEPRLQGASMESEAAPSRRAEKAVAKDDRAGLVRLAGRKAQPNDGAGAPIQLRTDFGSSAGWFPIISGVKGTLLSQPLKLKDSLTSWKAVATVVTAGPHLGQGSATIRTVKSLMVRLQGPRFFIEGDDVVLSAVVESHLPKETEVEVIIAAPGFKALSPGRKTLKIEPGQIVRVDAKFKVVELGEREIRATVRGGGTSDGMGWKLP